MSDEERAAFPGIVDLSRANGYEAIREVEFDELYRREPHLGPGARGDGVARVSRLAH